MTNRNQASFNFNGIIGFAMLILFFAALVLIVQGIFKILLFATPVLLVGALVFDYKGTFSFVTWIFKQIQKNLLPSLIFLGLAAFFWNISLPAIAAFLFIKALFKKKLRDVKKKYEGKEYEEKRDGDYIEYEEVKTQNKQQKLELPPLEKRAPESQKGSEYDTFFEE